MATRTQRANARGDGHSVAARDVHLRQRDEFGGLNWGGALFGWLVAVGIATLLTAVGGGKAGTRYHRNIDREGDDR